MTNQENTSHKAFNRVADMKLAFKVVSEVSKQIGDRCQPRMENHESWSFFRFCMGWDKSKDPWRFAQYLKALMQIFPNNPVSIIHGDISINYSRSHIYETFEDSVKNHHEICQNYISGILDQNLCDGDFIKEMRDFISASGFFSSGFYYQLMIDPETDVCKLSGINKGYFLSTKTLNAANQIKTLLKEKDPDSVVLICKKEVDLWYIVQTWEKYIPNGWKQAEFEHKSAVK